MSRKLTILFAPLDCFGHVNACTGVAEALRDRGHRIVFAIDQSWSRKLLKYGFEEELLSDPSHKEDENPGEFWVNFVKKVEKIFQLPPIEKIKGFGTESRVIMLNQALDNDCKIKEIIERIKPDVILVDNYASTPSILKSGIPWVSLVSANPLVGITDERTPPCYSGLPTNGDKKDWDQFKAVCKEVNEEVWNKFNKIMIDKGLPPLPYLKFIHQSPFLNIYAYPQELDYTDIRPLPEKWHQFDSFIRTEAESFEVPDKLKKGDGKLIYVSMGSMGSADLVLMNRLVSILSKSKNRFIVSKGPLHDKYELADNMWGQQMVPQTKVLSLVDLVITHGGNNTFCESFYFGKPMIVLPLFDDQSDNAQRIEEKGLGIRLDPYHCSEEELLNSIEKLLNDEVLAKRIKQISDGIQQSQSTIKVSEMIENLVK